MPFVSLNGRLCSLWVISRGAPCLLLHFSFMLHATASAASDEVPFVVPVRFATPVVFPMLQPPSSPFKRGDHQEPLTRNAQAESPHSSMSGELDTATTSTTSMPRRNLVVDPPPSDRELRPRSRPNPTCSGDDQPPAKKSHARKQPEGHIPRPRNAFILFRCDFVAQKKIPASVELDHRNISRIVGRIWKAMSDEERRPWNEEAKKERELHKKLYPQYRYSPSSTATSTTVTKMRTKRAKNKKLRESMGILPAWEVARQSPRLATETRSLRCDSSSEPTQLREDPQENAMSQAQTQTFVSDTSWSAVPDTSGVEAASHTIFRDPFLSWEPPSHQSWEFPGEHHSPRDGVAVTVGSCPGVGLDTPSSLRDTAESFSETPTPSFHYDSPDPSPMDSMLSPFMFVARHYATNNPGFSGFHFAPNPGEAAAAAASPFTDALISATDPAGQYQQQSTGHHMTGPGNILESFAWTTEQIDGIIRNMQSGPTARPLFDFDFAEPFVNL